MTAALLERGHADPANDPRDTVVLDALRPDCLPNVPTWDAPGCCTSCAGTGVSGDPGVPGGLCWDCRATAHVHTWVGSALRLYPGWVPGRDSPARILRRARRRGDPWANATVGIRPF